MISKYIHNAIRAIFVLAILPYILFAQNSSERLFPVKINGKFGYVNTKGVLVIKPQFDEAHNFQEGLAGVVMGGQRREGSPGYIFYSGGKFGYINTKGKFVVPLGKYAFGRGFVDGLAEVTVNGCEGKSCVGFIDSTGKIAIMPEYSAGSEFRDGFAVVRTQSGKYGVVDKSGKLIAAAIYDSISPISEGVFVANSLVAGSPNLLDNKLPRYRTVFIDRSGNITARPEQAVFSIFSEGLAQALVIVSDGSQDREIHGFVDKTGQFVIQPAFQRVGDFVGGLAPAQIRNKWGFIDQTGKFVIEPAYDAAQSFRDGLAKVSIDRKTGFIDRTGKLVIEPRSWTVEEFVNGNAFVTEGRFTGFIDKTGKYLWKKKFDR